MTTILAALLLGAVGGPDESIVDLLRGVEAGMSRSQEQLDAFLRFPRTDSLTRAQEAQAEAVGILTGTLSRLGTDWGVHRCKPPLPPEWPKLSPRPRELLSPPLSDRERAALDAMMQKFDQKK